MKSISTLTRLLTRCINPEFIRFVLVGATNTACGYGIYALALLVMGYKSAYSVSFVLSVLLSYWLNSHFVFKVRMSLKGLLRFPLVYVVQYLVGMLLLFLLVEKLGVPKLIAPLLIVVVTVPLTFVLSRALLRPGGTVSVERDKSGA